MQNYSKDTEENRDPNQGSTPYLGPADLKTSDLILHPQVERQKPSNDGGHKHPLKNVELKDKYQHPGTEGSVELGPDYIQLFDGATDLERQCMLSYNDFRLVKQKTARWGGD